MVAAWIDYSVLLLDDDPHILKQLENWFLGIGTVSLPCLDADQAIQALTKRPGFAIVDLFLEYNLAELSSNKFIAEHLVPAKIPYGRLTSAPSLVPSEYSGDWVLHKRVFLQNPDVLFDLLPR